ncbi:PREDICTED: uncharacterized protein LOC104817056 isoform X2 [Tarenaya hassleriana]|uniref:uncharacterized protein LOC104817056 isoform X2 n=1 Tax=Tarenaya hassleriana TaxID=28532 RepID=UPI00053C1E38|nr:PREDICTED: uncharacterized protein LOC104817056 isoform X2 [Tarenaya hassleriana]
MAPKRASPAKSSLYPIGGCDVVVEGKKFTCESGPKSLQISFSGIDRVRISAIENTVSTSPKDYTFLLLNPSDDDAFTKSYLQEVLKLYVKELPGMNYAANTGKQSTFLERCVSKGKYCTLILKAMLNGVSDEIIAAITYQIVPADAHYAEIPLAAVTSIYQKKHFGKLIYGELRKRLQNVGVRAIFCWADKESEGFWFKQGFISIAEVDKKGKARNLRIKTNIRKALCFPGGSTLMLSHLKRESSVNPANLGSCSSRLNHRDESPLSAYDNFAGPATRGCDNLLKPGESLKPREGFAENINFDRLSGSRGSVDSPTGTECHNMVIDEATTADGTTNGSTQGLKRTWEASLSSLQSKRVKGTHRCDCELDTVPGFSLGRTHKQPEDGFLGTSSDDPQTIISKRNDDEECRESNPNRVNYRIMLMNIGDDNKRASLTKVIENLGGVVTSEGSISTHVVTGKVRKTLNFCTALCSGAWIVSPTWLKESFQQGSFANETLYILKDEDYQLKYRTELKRAVLRAKARPKSLLKGYDIWIGTHVQKAVGNLSAIVQSAGGNVIREVDKVWKTILIASEEDMEEGLSAGKVKTFNSEWLMNCVMRQELDLEAPQFAESL